MKLAAKFDFNFNTIWLFYNTAWRLNLLAIPNINGLIFSSHIMTSEAWSQHCNTIHHQNYLQLNPFLYITLNMLLIIETNLTHQLSKNHTNKTTKKRTNDRLHMFNIITLFLSVLFCVFEYRLGNMHSEVLGRKVFCLFHGSLQSSQYKGIISHHI